MSEINEAFEAWAAQRGLFRPSREGTRCTNYYDDFVACWQEAARQAMEECRRLVLNEVLHLEDVNCEEDVAYNTAIDHAQKAIANRIRALADVAGEKGVGK